MSRETSRLVAQTCAHCAAAISWDGGCWQADDGDPCDPRHPALLHWPHRALTAADAHEYTRPVLAAVPAPRQTPEVADLPGNNGDAPSPAKPITERHSEVPGVKRDQQIMGEERTALARNLDERYRRGESLRTLAKSIGRSYTFVHGLLHEHGTKFRAIGWTQGGSKTP